MASDLDVNSADLGSRFLEEALGDAPEQDHEREPAPPVAAAPPAEPRRQGGLQPLVERKRKELMDLEKKISTHRETKAYTRQGSDGSEFFDYVSMQEDQVKMGIAARELAELKERDREYATTAQTRRNTAVQMAKTFLNKELAAMPEGLRNATAKAFGQMFREVTDENTWAKQEYADRAKVQRIIEQLFNTAYGAAVRQGAAPSVDGAPAASGLDARDEARRKPNPTAADEDDFTNNLMYAYDRRRQGSQTVAQAKAAAREAQK